MSESAAAVETSAQKENSNVRSTAVTESRDTSSVVSQHPLRAARKDVKPDHLATSLVSAPQKAMLSLKPENEAQGQQHDDGDDFVNVEKYVAEAEEEKRRQFDAVLERPLSHWTTVSDTDVLRATLKTLLSGLRASTGEAAPPHISAELSAENASPEAAVSAPSALPDPARAGSSLQTEEAAAATGVAERATSIRSCIDATRRQEVAQYDTRARYMPMRLTTDERQLLNIVEAALDVSEYTDRVDVLTYSHFKMRENIVTQIEELLSVLSGLRLSHDFNGGRKLLISRDLSVHAEYFRAAFEVARRHKVSNPEKMRSDYGKLIYMLQDAQSAEVRQMVGFNLVKPMVTVHSFLRERNALALLSDPRLKAATRSVYAHGTDRVTMRKELLEKAEARKALVKDWSLSADGSGEAALLNGKSARGTVSVSKGSIQPEMSRVDEVMGETTGHHRNGRVAYADSEEAPPHEVAATDGPQRRLAAEELSRVIDSISDGNTNLHDLRGPCTDMLVYLEWYFERVDAPQKGRSLAITCGKGGARLTHSHKQQYDYVLQSLTLWREVVNDMYKLWYLSEIDLLNPNTPYALRSTEQGLHRIQSAPRVSEAMLDILARTRAQVTSWVGSWAVHLGDRAVPNALTFIDKYNQVGRILTPIASTLRNLERLQQDDELAEFVTSKYGSVYAARCAILRDFFRHGFDGSGADNYYDAGGCVDGRLTSTWNWCSRIEKKSFFPLFLLTGFTGFDGQF